MIITNKKYLSDFASISSNFRTAIDYISNHNLSKIPFGKTIIDGNKVFINCFEYSTKAYSEAKYEFHQKYADIHLIVSGQERNYIVDSMELDIEQSYNFDTDAALGLASQKSQIMLDPELVAVYFPEDAHMVGINPSDESVKIHKIVVKVEL